VDPVGYNSDTSDIVDDQLKEAEKALIMTDESQEYNLYSIRLKMSMKRNILKKNLSEDLTWADFLKRETYNIPNSSLMIGIQRSSSYTRSMQSTPERKSEIPCESGKENLIQEISS
jgi:hypothetical protein